MICRVEYLMGSRDMFNALYEAFENYLDDREDELADGTHDIEELEKKFQ